MIDFLYVGMEFLSVCVKVLVAKQHETTILHSILNASLIDRVRWRRASMQIDCSLLYHCGFYVGSTCGLYLRLLEEYKSLNRTWGCLRGLWYHTTTTAPHTLVSAPDPNQPQRGSLPVSRVILDAIRAGVGLGLGPRLHTHKRSTYLQVNLFKLEGR